MAMLQFDSRFAFGKHHGQKLRDVFQTNPSYMCWLLETGFSEFGKDVTLALQKWMEENPAEVVRVRHRIGRKKLAEVEKKRGNEAPADSFSERFPNIAAAATAATANDPNWASW